MLARWAGGGAKKLALFLGSWCASVYVKLLEYYAVLPSRHGNKGGGAF